MRNQKEEPFALSLPSNLEAERAILGAVLLSPGLIRSVTGWIKPREFYLDSNKKIFSAMLALYNSGREVDPISLQDVLAARDDLTLVGGAAYIASLIDGVPRFSNVDEYVSIVKKKAKLREIIAFSNLVQGRAFDSDEPDDVLDYMRAWVRKSESAARDSGLVTNAELADTVYAQIMAAKSDPDSAVGLRTGLERFDASTNGVEQGQLWTIAGYSSLGKTTLALNWLENMTSRPAADGRRVVALYLTLEMTARDLFIKQVSQRTGIGGRALKQGRFLDSFDEKVYDAIESLRGCDVGYVSSVERGAEEIANRIDRMQARYGEDVHYIVFVDTLQLMANGSEDEYRAIARASRENKQIALDYNIPLVQLSQITVDGQKYDLATEPHEGMLRGAKSIYHDSDVVVFLHAPTGSTEDRERQLIKKKDRFGPRKEIFDIYFNPSSSTFTER